MSEKCPRCGQKYTKKNRKSTHHILPKRWFGQTNYTFDLCRQCHDLLEEVIRGVEKRIMQLNKEAFVKCFTEFIKP